MAKPLVWASALGEGWAAGACAAGAAAAGAWACAAAMGHRPIRSANTTHLIGYPSTRSRDTTTPATKDSATRVLPAVKWVGGVRRDPLDARVRTLDRGHLDLDEELGAREP